MTYYSYPGICASERNWFFKVPDLPLYQVEKAVCIATGISPIEMKTQIKFRKGEFAKARQIFFYLAKKYTSRSLSFIGSYYTKNHATALHGIRSITNIAETRDKTFHPILSLAESHLKSIIYEKYAQNPTQITSQHPSEHQTTPAIYRDTKQKTQNNKQIPVRGFRPTPRIPPNNFPIPHFHRLTNPPMFSQQKTT